MADHPFLVNGAAIPGSEEDWARSEATLEKILEVDTNQERHAWTWQLVALGAVAFALSCMGLTYWALFTRPEVEAFVQVVHVDDQGMVSLMGEPTPMERYTPQDGQWIAMLSEWVMRLRWRGIDKPQAQQAWKWLDLYTCGIAREQLGRYVTVEKPMENLGIRKRQVVMKNIVKSDMPHAWTVIWEEMEVNGPQAPVVTMNSGTVTVGRRAVDTATIRMINPFGLCVSGFNWAPQP